MLHEEDLKTPRDAAEGIEVTDGDEATREAREVERNAQRGGEADPLEGLAATIAESGETERAFERKVLAALVRLQRSDPEEYQRRRRELRGAKVPVGELDRQLRALVKENTAAEAGALSEWEKKKRKAKAVSEAKARDKAKAAALEERPELEAHYASKTIDRTTYTMEPRKTSKLTPHPEDEDAMVSTTLAGFSAVIAETVHEVDVPEGEPRRTFKVEALVNGDEALRAVEVSGEDFPRMEWVEPRLGARATIYGGRGYRDAVRIAMMELSKPVVTWRFRFTGWHRDDGRWVYLHAGGAIGEGGPVEGFTVSPPAPGDRFKLPAEPDDETFARGAEATLELFNVEPAAVTVPLVALAFRAMMGPTRCTVHLSGRPATGKSLLASLVARYFGATMNPGALPASWADGSSSNGLTRTLSRVGDAVVVIDDLRIGGGARDVGTMECVDRVIRAHYNRAAPRKLTREGGERNDPVTRAAILSTGEVLPRGHSLRTRVVLVHLERRAETDLDALSRRASDGELVAVTSRFVRWHAPNVEKTRPELEAMARDAARRYGFEGEDRTVDLLGDLMVGAEHLAAFLEDAGVIAEVGHEALVSRAAEALRGLAAYQRDAAADEDPARRLLRLVGENLRACAAHVVVTGAAGRTVPSIPHAWGYKGDGSVWHAQGRCVGYLTPAHPGEVLLDGAAALDVARDAAKRANDPLALDAASLGRALHAAGLLARTDLDTSRKTFTVRLRIGGGVRLPVFAVRLEALGFERDELEVAGEAKAA